MKAKLTRRNISIVSNSLGALFTFLAFVITTDNTAYYFLAYCIVCVAFLHLERNNFFKAFDDTMSKK